MAETTADSGDIARSTYRHEALFYAGIDGFIDALAPFIEQGVECGEPVLVVVSADKIARLRERLGSHADQVEFADMADVGSNPARIIPLWHEFVERHAGQKVRGVGEPIYPERSAVELVECQQHEALLNIAFDAAAPLWLLCPYDTTALGPDVLTEALHSHPVVLERRERRASDRYRDDEVAPAALAMHLDEAPADAPVLHFTCPKSEEVREFIYARAREAGLSSALAGNLVLAVCEAATGEGAEEVVARIALWNDGSSVICELADSSMYTDPLVGRRRPTGSGRSNGLWLVNQLCDLVQLRSSPLGRIVRMHINFPVTAT